MSKLKKVPNAEVAASWLHAHTESGLPFPGWCAREGVDGRSLLCWRRALAARGRRSEAPRLVELLPTLPTPQSVTVRPARAPSPLRVHVGDVVVEVNEGFDAAMLTGVVQALRAC